MCDYRELPPPGPLAEYVACFWTRSTDDEADLRPRIVRFRRWLRLAQRTPVGRSGLAELAVAAGYADQAHLTREVTRLAGVPPALLSGA